MDLICRGCIMGGEEKKGCRLNKCTYVRDSVFLSGG